MVDPDICDLLDMEQLRRLLETQYRMTGVCAAVLDADENVLVSAGWQEICTRFHRCHPTTLARCRQSDAYIKSHLANCPRGYVDYRCQNGLWDVAMPILIEGRHRATFFTGQFFYDDDSPDLDFFRAQAEECGFDQAAYLEAVRRVPVVSREQIRHVMEYFRCLVEVISDTGLKNLRLGDEIRERIKSEQEAQFFRNLVETSQDPIYVLDPGDGYRMYYANAAACAHFGQKKAAVLRMRIPDWDPVFDMADTGKLYAQMLQHKEVLFETVHRGDAGRLIPVEVSANLLVQGDKELIAGFFRDISQRKAMETALKESQRNLLEAQRIARVGNWCWSFDGRLLSVSLEGRRILGVSGGQLAGDEAAYLQWIREEDRAQVEQALAALRCNLRPCAMDYVLRRPDGEDVAIHEQREVQFDDAGRPVALIGTIQDVTEQRNLMASLREKDLLLMQQSRMATMGEMISYIAHQWRQPLHIVSLLVQGLEIAPETGADREGEIHRTVETIMDLIQHMASTITDFRDFFRTDKEKNPFDLEQAITRVLAFVAADMTHHKIDLRFEAGDVVPVLGHANEFSHVLLNLINNARDALLEKRSETRRIHIRLFQEGARRVVVVGDNAGGIPAASLERIFDAYFSTKAGGTGIGLYISKVIVEKSLGGRLSASNVGDGAEFCIEL